MGREQKSKTWQTSSALQLVVLLGVLFVLAVTVPNRYLDAADGIPSHLRGMVAKLSDFLKSNEDPDVLVLGSSLILVPAVRCDDQFEGREACYQKWYYYKHIREYTKVDYLQAQLEEKAGTAISVRNLAVIASLMSDHAAILETALRQGKHPAVVICGIAPRDFMDRGQIHPELSATRLLLSELEDSQDGLLAALSKNPQRAYPLIEHHLIKLFAATKHFAINTACALSHHPDSLQNAKVASADSSESEYGRKLAADLKAYKGIYNPPHMAMLSEQTKDLERMLAVARQNNVRVVLVNMPLTQQNISMLEPAARATYERNISSLANQYGALFLDANKTEVAYTEADFEDSCHLNGPGGKKFFDSLSQLVASDKKILAGLYSRSARAIAAGRSSVH